MIIRTVHILRLFLLISLTLIVGIGCVSTPDHIDQQVNSVILQADTLRSSEKYFEAAEVYARALEQFPSDIRLRYNYAITLAESGKIGASLTILDQLQEDAEEGDYTYLKSAAGIASSAGERNMAGRYWQEILEKNPYDEVVRELYLNELIGQEQYEQAYLIAIDAYELNLFEPELFAHLTFLAQKIGKPEAVSWQIIHDTLVK